MPTWAPKGAVMFIDFLRSTELRPPSMHSTPPLLLGGTTAPGHEEEADLERIVVMIAMNYSTRLQPNLGHTNDAGSCSPLAQYN